MADIPGAPSVFDLPGLEQVEAVGRGGFATVYRGWQPAFNRAVAVKVLTHDPGGSTGARFDKEARALGSLSGHPHVVGVYQAGTVGDRPYLVMPYMEGGCLEDRLRARPVAPTDAVRVIAAIAGAVTAAHRLGILHRDIKPANILFTSGGDPKLADFGIARLSDSTMTSGLVAATVAYAAPEVLGGAQASEAADVYSLGATLYAALRGAPAFEPRPGEAPIAFAVRVYSDPVPDLAATGVPPALAAVVARAMAKDPADRYESADAFRAALLGADLSSPAAPPPAQPGALRRRTAAAVAAVALLVGGGTAAAVELGGQGSGRPHVAGPAPAATTPSASTPAVTTPTTSPAPPTTASPPPTTTPATAPPPTGATLTGTQPPSAHGVTTAAALPASTLTDTLDAYYALVDQHRLDASWTWLTSSYQQRLGSDYYHRFWNGITDVQLISVDPRTGGASLQLRYVETSGTVSTESADITFAVDPATNRILIASYQVTG